MTSTPIASSYLGLNGWAAVIAKQGITAMIAAFLIWFVTQGISSDMKTMRDDLRTHMQETRFYSRQICINTAKDDAQRASCLQRAEDFSPISR